MTRRYSSSCF